MLITSNKSQFKCTKNVLIAISRVNGIKDFMDFLGALVIFNSILFRSFADNSRGYIALH